MNTILINLLMFIFISSCSSTKVRNCKIVKHEFDEVYKIQIDEKDLSKQWFLKDDAQEIVTNLIQKNKCQKNIDSKI